MSYLDLCRAFFHPLPMAKFNNTQRYNRRVVLPLAPKPISSRRFTPQQMTHHSAKNDSGHMAKLELSHENYTAYVLMQIFDAYYIPWLKDCYGSSHLADFSSRLDHLSQSLETAFSEYASYKRRISSMAKRNAFQLLRKLKVSIDDVRKCSNNGKHRVTGKCLRVRIRTKNMAVDGVESFYHSNYPIQLQANYIMYIDFPIELNDANTKVFIEFLLTDFSLDEMPQADQPPVEEMFTDKEMLLQVKEVAISGFTGYNTKCTILDETINEAVELKLSLSWDLNIKSIQEQVKWGNIVASHFSMALLATGAYFFRFYSTLYNALLLHKDTEIESIKCLNEVAFIISTNQKPLLFKPLLAMLHKRVVGFEPVQGDTECSYDDCEVQFQLIHGVFLIIEHLPVDDQDELIEELRAATFTHLLRFRCVATPIERMLQLQRMALRRLMVMAKKGKHRSAKKTEPFLEYLLEVLIDTVKRPELAQAQSEDDLMQLQDSAVKLFAKFLTLMESEQVEVATKVDEESDEEESYSTVENTDSEAVTTSKDPMSSSVYTSVDRVYDIKKKKQSTAASTTIAASSDHHMKDLAFELAYENFAHNPLQQYDCALLYSMLPAKIVEQMASEEVLSGEYYEPMLALVRKIAQEQGDKDDE